MHFLNVAVLVVVLETISCVSSIPLKGEPKVSSKLIQYESTDTDNGHKFSYDTDDGQSRDEELIIKNKGSDEEEIVITGQYSFQGTDGLTYTVKYTADKNGYRAHVHAPYAKKSKESVHTHIIQPSVFAPTPPSLMG